MLNKIGFPRVNTTTKIWVSRTERFLHLIMGNIVSVWAIKMLQLAATVQHSDKTASKAKISLTIVRYYI